MNVSKIKSFFTLNKKSLFYVWFFLFSLFVFSDAVFAVTPEWEKDPITTAINAVNGLLLIAAALLWAVTSLASLFLTPEWVNGTLFGLDQYMKDIWILVSNVIYFIFALILIAIAFMNIIGSGWDTWQLKSALPKFIVWVIMVPFTWFFVQFILSISAILTVWVLTLPYDTFNGNEDFQNSIEALTESIAKGTSNQTDTNKIPKNFILDLSQKIGSWSTTSDAKSFFQTSGETDLKTLLSWDGQGGHKNSIFWVLSVYTYGVMQVQKTGTIDGKATQSDIRTLWDLTLKMIFDAVFVLVYLILMVALFLALLVRGIKLWLYAMLSPAFWLLYFFWKNDWIWDGNGKFGVKDFISLALVPVYVAAALSFWLLFIMVSSYWIKDGQVLGDCTDSVWAQIEWTEGAQCMDIGWFNFGIKWAHGSENSATSASSAISGALGKLIMELFGIVILWVAIMAALKQSEITNKITEPIQQFGWNVWSLIAKSPMYAPVIPGWLSVEWLQRVSTMPKQALESRVADRASPYQGKINALFWANTIPVSETARFDRILANWIEKPGELDEARKMYMGWVSEFGRNNSKVAELEQDLFEKMKVSSVVKWQWFNLGDQIDNEFFAAILWDTKRNSQEISNLRNAKNPGTFDRNSRTAADDEATTNPTPVASGTAITKIWSNDANINIDITQDANKIAEQIRWWLDSTDLESGVVKSGVIDEIKVKLGYIDELDTKLDDIITSLSTKVQE